jgi:hypothetical protein
VLIEHAQHREVRHAAAPQAGVAHLRSSGRALFLSAFPVFVELKVDHLGTAQHKTQKQFVGDRLTTVGRKPREMESAAVSL